MCAIYSLCIILLVNNIRVRNFHRFGWNENFNNENFAKYGITLFVPRLTLIHAQKHDSSVDVVMHD